MKAVKQSKSQLNAKWNRLVKRSEAIKEREYRLTLDLIAYTLRLPKISGPAVIKDMVKVAKQLDKALTQADKVCDEMRDLNENKDF